MVIAPIFKAKYVNPKTAAVIYMKAGDEDAGCLQLTKAYVCLLEELSYVFRRPQLHEWFNKSGIDIQGWSMMRQI